MVETREHMTIVREIIKGRDSPVTRCATRAGEIRDGMSTEKQVSNDQPPHRGVKQK